MRIPKVFFFIKYFKLDFMNYFNTIKNLNAIFLFDLEDSIQDSFDITKSLKLKKKYRTILKEILIKNNEINLNYKIGIRINVLTSEEFSKDIKLLASLKSVNWETIIIPKIETRKDIEFIIAILEEKEIKYNHLTIIAETKKGVSNLCEIIHPEIKKLKYVIFGHADFNADNEIFPFKHQNHKDYWDWVDEIIYKLRETSLVFVNSPCLFLNDSILFKSILDNLHCRFNSEFGQVTLTVNQTKMSLLHEHSEPISTNNSDLIKLDPLIFAKSIMMMVDSKKLDKGFVINEKGYLISPHEIVLAKKLLNS